MAGWVFNLVPLVVTVVWFPAAMPCMVAEIAVVIEVVAITGVVASSMFQVVVVLHIKVGGSLTIKGASAVFCTFAVFSGVPSILAS